MTKDTLANSVYGMDTDMQANPNNSFFDHVLQLLKSGLEYNWFITFNSKNILSNFFVPKIFINY